ncbi:MAG: hypothetical protein ACM3S1_11320 [Hyphomicrobiales bacterium]
MRGVRAAAVVTVSLVAGYLWSGAALSDFAFAQEPLSVAVTNAGDGIEGAVCPDDALCTLRAAIALVNADEGTDEYHITFAPELFGDAGAVVALASPLPPVRRANVVIDGHGGTLDERVVIDGGAIEGAAEGLRLEGEGDRVADIAVRNFATACVVLAGASQAVTGSTVDACGAGVAVLGEGATVAGNEAGLHPREGDTVTMLTGISVQASRALVGQDGGQGAPNHAGNVPTGVQVGGESGGVAISDISVSGNVIGRAPDLTDTPVGIGVQIRPPANAILVANNNLANSSVAAIQVTDGEDSPVSGATFRGNTFEISAGMAIDLGADGVRNANDAGDEDTGPNGFLNHPEITRPTQSSITGQAEGCGGCTVEIYLASHTPGGATDYGVTPLPFGTVGTLPEGQFLLGSPAVVPGQWVIALVTDPEGNTSEFGRSARVGTGVVQCGNRTLHPGWNHVGYFGAVPLPLNNEFPGGTAGSAVSAIYQLEDGSGEFLHWFADEPFSRTLTTLQPGEAYWFYAEAGFSLPDGFALSTGLPVELKAGWNDFVYFGATVDAADALSSVAGTYDSVFRYTNTGLTEGWKVWAPGAPGYAVGFDDLQACETYQVFVTEDATLVPPQP